MSEIKPSVGPFCHCKPITRQQLWEELTRLFAENAYSHMIQVRYMGPLTGTYAGTGIDAGFIIDAGTLFYGYQVAITTSAPPTEDPTVSYAELTTTRYYAVWINAPKGE